MFHFGCQLIENILERLCVMVGAFLLIEQCYIYKCHQRYYVFAFTGFVCRSVCIISFSDELCCRAIELLIVAVDYHFDFLVIDVQLDM